MAEDFNREKFVKDLATAVEGIDAAVQMGTELGQQGFKRLYLIGCGAPNRAMLLTEYWLQHYATNLEIRRYFPAEFIYQNPPNVDENTLVILGSHSGTTPETVAAAKFLQDKPCTTVGITQKKDSPLAQNVQQTLLYGESDAGYYAMHMLLLALVSGFFKEVDQWPLHDTLIPSLKALPEAIADATEANDPRAAEHARLYKDEEIMYIVGGGPMYTTAYVIGTCIMMEMLWMQVQPLEGAEFFHGPFEIVNETTPLILLVGEGPSRPIDERVVRFCKKYTEKLMIWDAQDFEMKGIAEDIRPILAPLFIEAALSRMTVHLSVWHNNPLSTRHYMWKTEY